VIDFLKHLQSRGLLTLQRDEVGGQHFIVECTFKDLPPSTESEQTRQGQIKPRCKRCGASMDLLLAEYGYHLGCD
jgi:hypothetical protein